MKRHAFISVIAVLALAGCTQQLWLMGDKDHTLLSDTQNVAQQAKTDSAQAKTDSAQAAQDAKAAREAAEKALELASKAAADAQAASEKADKMFQSSQNK